MNFEVVFAFVVVLFLALVFLVGLNSKSATCESGMVPVKGAGGYVCVIGQRAIYR